MKGGVTGVGINGDSTCRILGNTNWHTTTESSAEAAWRLGHGYARGV